MSRIIDIYNLGRIIDDFSLALKEHSRHSVTEKQVEKSDCNARRITINNSAHLLIITFIKLSLSLSLTLSSLALAASFAMADDLTPVSVTVQNHTFDNGVEGWLQSEESGNGWRVLNRSQDTDDGNNYLQLGGNVNPNSYIYQDIQVPEKGVYVLSANTIISETKTWTQIAENDGVVGFICIGAANSEDVEDATVAGFTKVMNKLEDDPQKMRTHYAFVKVDDSFIDSVTGEPTIRIAYGNHKTSKRVTNSAFRADKFVVERYNTDDVPAVKKLYGIDDSLVSTAVEEIEVAPVIEDNRWFNLQGIQIAEPTQSGIYIHNGKKVLINK